jgi:hypothetical protein
MAKNKIAVIGCHNCRRKPAAYTEVRSNSSGTIIGSRPDFYLFCEDCLKLALRMELGVVALEFHRIRDFSYAGARDWFIRELYYVFTGKRVRKITADMAFEFFSPQPSLF